MSHQDAKKYSFSRYGWGIWDFWWLNNLQVKATLFINNPLSSQICTVAEYLEVILITWITAGVDFMLQVDDSTSFACYKILDQSYMARWFYEGLLWLNLIYPQLDETYL